jgi:asparagine synthase (glutamine-hydrolysing)
MFVGRDPYGVRPLYYLHSPRKQDVDIFGFASEIKQLVGFQGNIRHFQPGMLMSLEITTIEYDPSETWKYNYSTKYHDNLFSFDSLYIKNDLKNDLDNIYHNIRRLLFSAVEKRCKCTERPVACLLSGGLDSSLIASIVNHLSDGKLNTYSIGFENSQDLKMARLVSNFLGTQHHEVVITQKEYLDAIPHVIEMIESYDTTTVRASIGNYLIAKYISENSDAKVIFNGDGSDELTGGYMYMHNCPDSIEFDKETRRLLKNIHCFDVLRSDKSISSNGLEARTPFLDLEFVRYYHFNFRVKMDFLLKTYAIQHIQL